MPGFVKTPKDERRWARAKEAAGKSTAENSESYWRLSNFIYHKMGKTEEDHKLADFYKKEMMQKDVLPMASRDQILKSVGQIGKQSTAVKTPKSKKMPGAFSKPSAFFKTENFKIKHPSIQKLRDFLMKRKQKP